MSQANHSELRHYDTTAEVYPTRAAAASIRQNDTKKYQPGVRAGTDDKRR